jgi:hypothetical protein
VPSLDFDAPVARVAVRRYRQHGAHDTQLFQRGARDAFYVLLFHGSPGNY